jgi:threonine dehydrogenase-like Zn-dependent dehydrogenase
MRAVCWYGANKVGMDTVPDPVLINPHDAIIKVKLASICGSDLHIYDGFIPTMQAGDIIGHEFMGEVVEVGREVQNLKPGDRVVVPSIISCGRCFYCQNDLWSLCDNTNPNAWMAEKAFGYSGAGIYGYSHLFGGYSGAFAEYIRVPFADVGPVKIPDNLTDEQVLFISDAFPTGFMAADNCNIKPGDIVAVWGCGAVGLFAMASAWMLGAERVIAIDRIPERLEAARNYVKAEPLNLEEVNVVEALATMTGGRGPDCCIDAVGMEAHASGLPGLYDVVKQGMRVEMDRPHVLRQAIQACRKGGTFSIVGVYAGLIDKLPMGAAFNKGLTFRMGQMHAHKYMPMLVERVARGDIDPSFAISYKMSLDEAARGFEIFKKEQDRCLRVVFTV